MEKFISCSRDQQLLLPYDLRDWVSDDDFVHFIIESVESINLERFTYNRRGTGSDGYHPHVLLSLLIYCYANGVFSSRRIERASYQDISVRYILSNTHPDHSTIAKFRRNNVEAISEAFLTVLKLARELKILNVGTISVDGTKIKANASKNKNIRYDRAQELELQLEQDISELMSQAESADTSDTMKKEVLPKEIQRREALRKKLQDAQKKIEEREHARYEKEKKAYEKKEEEDKTKPPRTGPKRKAPTKDIRPDAQYNFTDADSRLMRKNSSSGVEQDYNAQMVVDGNMLAVGNYVTPNGSDKQELTNCIESVLKGIGTIETVLADAGYGSKKEIEKVKAKGIRPLVSVHSGGQEEGRHYDFRPQKEKRKVKKHMPWVEEMQRTMKESEARKLYKMRQQTVEPVFGIIKHAMGFRQFLTRGIENVTNEWNLVTTAYNFKRLFNIIMAKQ